MSETQNVNYGEIKEEIKKLQLTILVKFFECTMYYKFKKKWKEKVIKKARYKYLKKDHALNYTSLINATNTHGEFNIEVLDITATVALICYDFLDACCEYKKLDKDKLFKIITDLRKDRNLFAHSSLDEDEFQNCSQALNHLNQFIAFLEKYEWQYEINDEFLDYLRVNSENFDEETFFLEEIKKKLLDCEGELKSQHAISFKKVIIEFVDDKQNAIDGIKASVISKKNPEMLNYTIEKNMQELPLPLGEYIITCLITPNLYSKFEPVAFVIKASDNNEIHKKIILKENGYQKNLAAEKSDSNSLFEQGRKAYERSKQNGGDYSEAYQLFKEAAEKGNADAINILGYMYSVGEGVTKNGQKAVELYETAANYGCVDAIYSLGYMYASGDCVAKNYKKAFELYEKAANQGHVAALNNLGTMYDSGKGIKEDYQKAVELYKKAAEQGNICAISNLGHMYARGKGVSKSYQKAAELFEKAAEQGYGPAIYNLGYMYFLGNGVKKDYDKAIELYERAAGYGFEEAKYECEKLKYKLGEMYFYGKEVKKDYNKALRYYSGMYSLNKFADIEYKLGKCYEFVSKSKKSKSQEKDECLIKATEHYRNAAKNNFEPARIALYNLLKKHPELKLAEDAFLIKEEGFLKKILTLFR